MLSLKAAYTVKELSKELGLSPQTIRDWIKSGKILSVKKGKHHLIPFDALRSALPEFWGSIILLAKARAEAQEIDGWL